MLISDTEKRQKHAVQNIMEELLKKAGRTDCKSVIFFRAGVVCFYGYKVTPTK